MPQKSSPPQISNLNVFSRVFENLKNFSQVWSICVSDFMGTEFDLKQQVGLHVIFKQNNISIAWRDLGSHGGGYEDELSYVILLPTFQWFSLPHHQGNRSGH